MNFLNDKTASSHIQDLQNNLKKEIEEKSLHSLLDNLNTEMHQVIDTLYASGIFSQNDNAYKFPSIYDNSLIYLINQNTLNTVFMILLFKSNLALALGAPILTTDTYKKKRKKFSLYLRNVPIIKGMAIIPAQARSLNISFSISFKNFNPKINNTELLSIIGNTNTKIISPTENTFIDILKDTLDFKIENNNSNLNNQNTLKYFYLAYKNKTYKLSNDSFYTIKIS